VVLGLHDDEATRKIWPHHFHLTIQIDLRSSPTDSSSLTITLGVVNENTNQPFSFSTALHTYFAVNDVEKVGIHKLGGCDVLDKVTGAKKTTPTDEIVRLTDETDRIYYKFVTNKLFIYSVCNSDRIPPPPGRLLLLRFAKKM
jgi:glucose-6-phosphate 1-epimerase